MLNRYRIYVLCACLPARDPSSHFHHILTFLTHFTLSRSFSLLRPLSILALKGGGKCLFTHVCGEKMIIFTCFAFLLFFFYFMRFMC